MSVLDEFRRLLDSASPEPWEVRPAMDHDEAKIMRWPETVAAMPGGYNDAADADLIAFLRNHAEDLLAVARAAREWVKAYNAEKYTDDEADAKELTEAALVRLSPTSEEGS